MAAHVPPHKDPKVLNSFKRTINAWILSPHRMSMRAQRAPWGMGIVGIGVIVWHPAMVEFVSELLR